MMPGVEPHSRPVDMMRTKGEGGFCQLTVWKERLTLKVTNVRKFLNLMHQVIKAVLGLPN